MKKLKERRGEERGGGEGGRRGGGEEGRRGRRGGGEKRRGGGEEGRRRINIYKLHVYTQPKSNNLSVLFKILCAYFTHTHKHFLDHGIWEQSDS